MKEARIRWSVGLALAVWAASAASAVDPQWRGGLMMGYSYGQNGQGWPSPWNDPLNNHNRGGFQVSQARVQGILPFDSTFKGVITGNIIGLDPQEVYLEKAWGEYRFKAGKFRGAGLRSGSGSDEFDFTTPNRPRYARLWGHYKKTHNFRDFGLQGERDFFSGRFRNRLFFHNANGQNVFNDEPSFPAGPTTQALGLDYAAEFRISPYNQVGGHVGALANEEWDEFIGGHDFWEAQYWFKSNALVDASVNHQMDFPRFHMENEALVMSHRTLPDADGTSMITWGFSSLVRFDQVDSARRWSPYLGFEFVDNSDGRFPNDALSMVKAGTLFRPSPVSYPDMRLTAQYVRALEEGGENSFPNDILYVHYQMRF